MSYSTEVKKFGRIPTVFIDLEMDFCALRSGIGACTATQTGDAKCYNTYATCNDKPHFNKTTKVYRFCEQNADLPVGLPAIPLLKSVSFASQEITPGKGLGVRGSVSITLLDAPWPDTEIDPYWKERTYNRNTGTFWGKSKARNPFYENRVLRVRRGYLTKNGFDWANFIDSVYIIEQLQGIAKDDTVKIVAKDILKLADDKKALFPKPSNGRLSANIDAVQTTFTLSPSGIGSEYKISGKLAISGEMMSYTRSGDMFTVVRGVSNTKAESHNNDDTVQEVGIFTNQKVQDVIYDVLTLSAGISTGYINKTAWDAEATAYLAGVWSAEIPEPTGVNTLIGELTEQGTCRVWWDEEAQLIQFRAIKPLPSSLPILSDDSHFLTKTLDVKTDTNQRISTVFIYFAQKLPTKKLDDLENYALRVATPNLAAISDLEYGSNLIKKVFSRWFKPISQGRANVLADALLKTYRDPPQIAEFSLTPAFRLKVGDLFYAQTRKIQSLSGMPANVPMEVVYAQPTDKDDIKYKAQQVSEAIPVGNTFKVILSDSLYVDLNLYDAFVAEYGLPESGITVEFEVLTDVLITASTTANYALTNPDSWPSDCYLELVVDPDAIIFGLGGNGGNGGNGAYSIDATNGQNGQNGGHALLAQYPISINNQSVIAGGGGGGGAGGGGGSATNGTFIAGGGGGGAGGGGRGVAIGGTKGLLGTTTTGGGSYTITLSSNGFDGTNGTISAFGTKGAHGNGGSVSLVDFYSAFGGNGGNGGDGGDFGQNGASGVNGRSAGLGDIGTRTHALGIAGTGGAAGDAVHGNSYITWISTGTIYGNII